MRILVCVKEVIEFDPDDEVVVDLSGRWIETDDRTVYKLNRFDEYAVEEALQIAESIPGSSVHAITVGAPRSEAALRRVMGMGVDQGVHLVTRQEGYIAPHLISSWIFSFLKTRSEYDLILTGAMSEDMGQSQVGPLVAAGLQLPFASSVIHQEIDETCENMYIEREIEGGSRELCTIRLPALISVQPGINSPRYPSLSKVLRAKKAELERVETDSLPGRATGVTLNKVVFPSRERSGKTLEGSPREKARELLAFFNEKLLLARNSSLA